MPKRTPKKYNVTVSYAERTPEEAARIEQEITEAIYRCKMEIIKRKATENQKTTDKTIEAP